MKENKIVVYAVVYKDIDGIERLAKIYKTAGPAKGYVTRRKKWNSNGYEIVELAPTINIKFKEKLAKLCKIVGESEDKVLERIITEYLDKLNTPLIIKNRFEEP